MKKHDDGENAALLRRGRWLHPWLLIGQPVEYADDAPALEPR